MKRNIIIVDDFYQNPDEVRNFALSQEYFNGEHDTYPGKNSKENYYPEDLHKKIERVVNKKLTPAPQNGYFRISLKNDSFKQDVHVDPIWEWGAVMYLSKPEDCFDEAGTSFWMHNKTKMEFYDMEYYKNYGYSSYEEFWKTTIYSDGLDRSKWSRTLLCPMKYNRFIIFRANLWHSHSENFGNNLNDGRLVQLFFFNRNNFLTQ
jgi:hypothetical protein